MAPPFDADNAAALIRNAPRTARGDRIGESLDDWKNGKHKIFVDPDNSIETGRVEVTAVTGGI